MKKNENPNNESVTEEITIEEGLGRLDEILLAMESKGTDLTASFNLYEEGIRLLKGVSAQIDNVEKKVMVLREGKLEALDSDSNEE